MILVDEKLSADPLRSEVVLHVRRHLRRALRAKQATPQDLALLFGLSYDQGERLELRRALKSASPIAAAAELIAAATTPRPSVITLGHDDEHIERCHAWLRERKSEEPAFDDIIATDLEMLLVLSKARDYATGRTPDASAGSDIPILIEGDTGTGKELLARAIHEIWARGQPNCSGFFPVQVAGLPPDLINDELFGHTRGAFTGASEARSGRLEDADRGTVLIDEIGDLPPAAQVRLLRFLQDQKLSRAGESKERQVQVRILAATWHPLDADVARGAFRGDLLYRVRVGWLRLPSLRTRTGMFTEVVPELLRKMGQTARPQITRSATDALALYPWPGNLRELVGILRVALSSSDGSTVRLEDLPSHLQRPYLDQPLFVRAPGFLCDETDGQEMTEALATWRVAEVARSLNTLMAPEDAADASALYKFFASIPDASEEHQATVRHLQQSLELTREQRHLAAIGSVWKWMRAARGLHQETVRAIDGRIGSVDALREKTDRAVEALSAATHLKTSPWFMFVTELRQLPVFTDQDPTVLLSGFVPFLRLFASVSPQLFEMVRGFASEGNVLERLRQLVAEKGPELLEAANDDEQQDDDSDPQGSDLEALGLPSKPRDWLVEHGQSIVAAFPSKAEAVRALGIDVKTITKHLKRLGIEQTWRGV
jgi:DNA-binding NtrC family response regulator